MRAFLIAPILALILPALSARASEAPNPFLKEARVFFEDLEYQKCVRRLEAGSDWHSEAAELVEVELLSGLCKAHMGRNAEAVDHFKTALHLNPQSELPPATSPKVISLFEDAKSRVRAEVQSS